ncbi:MAG: ATP-binding protein [Anaerolineales bacterium]|nr:ATP-binding protein [Anaerolineales bacterium]
MSIKSPVGMHNFSSRLLLAFVAIIVITALLTGVPTYLAVHSELEDQAWARLSVGGKVTLTLLETEKVRLSNLASLASQRPTLQNLIQLQEFEDLTPYLKIFQKDTDLDILMLTDQSGKVLAEGTLAIPSMKPSSSQQPFFQVMDGTNPQMALLVSKPVQSDPARELYITVGIILDDGYMNNLAKESGFDQSLIINGNRIVTTIRGAPEAVSPEIYNLITTSGKTEMQVLNFDHSHYYVTLMPLPGTDDDVIGISEVALPMDDLVRSDQAALVLLILITVLVCAAASIIAGWFARRLTAPLKDLTGAAINISQGDFDTPIPIPAGPDEIVTLAAAFEKSRVNALLALEDLSQTKEWSDTLIQSVVEAIVTIDDEGQVTSFSQGAERISGWKRAKVLGLSINRVFPLVESKDKFTEHIPPFGSVNQVTVQTREGKEITLAVTSAQLKPPSGEEKQVALVLRDITEEDSARRLSSYFLANISHEFRTPLAALNASVELLLEEMNAMSLGEIAKLLNSIHLGVTSLQTLIDNLLESASMEAGQFRIRRHPTDLVGIVTEATRVMKPLLERRQQELSLDMPAKIPRVNADPTRLTQVLVNLLSNASKYSPMETTIALSWKTERKTAIRITVSDRGPGIPQSERSRLFQRFVRLGLEDRAQYGIGLGLSVVKTIVEAHGGEVGVDENPAGGSRFWITIPLKDTI